MISNGSSTDGIADLAAECIGDGYRDLAPLERILIRPLDDVRRPVFVGAEQLSVDEKLDRSKRRSSLRLNLRDNADAAGHTAPAERRRYSYGWRRSIAGGGGRPVSAVRGGRRLQEQRDESGPDEHVNHA